MIAAVLALAACAPVSTDPVDPVVAPDGMSFAVDASLDPVEAAPLRAALTRVAARWAKATCLPITVADEAANVVTMRDRSTMHDGAMGRTEGQWDAVVVKAARGYDLVPVLLHELGHSLGRTNDHAEIYTDAEGVEHAGFAAYTHENAHITANDLALVCERRACECFQPEA